MTKRKTSLEHEEEGLKGNGRDGTWRELACISGNWMLLQLLVEVPAILYLQP